MRSYALNILRGSLRCPTSLSCNTIIPHLPKTKPSARPTRHFSTSKPYKMASPSRVHLSATDRPVYAVPQLSQDVADKVSDLLNENHKQHHIFFNSDGFHNHIVHHLFTLYALGATKDQIQRQYDLNASYQRPPEPLKRDIVADMRDPAHFDKYLGNEEYYHDFLVFFEEEMAQKGWEAVVNDYLFKGDDRADDMLVRLFAGFLHPLIHLGFGVEFRQPAIIAEALAQTAVHSNWIGKLYLPAEKAAAQDKGPGASLVELVQELQGNKKLAGSAHWGDSNKIRDGILVRAADEMVALAAKYKVGEGALEERLAEMINFNAYFTLAAQRPPKRVKLDFFFIHCLNSSIFFPAFLGPDSPLSTSNKRRLLEWKGRSDLALYASRGTPPLNIEEITTYTPKVSAEGGKDGDAEWKAIFERVCDKDDDGHASKCLRALANGEKICNGRAGGDWKIDDRMWLRMGHMGIDSVEYEDESGDWVRGAGFGEAWEKVDDRDQKERGEKGTKKMGEMGYEGHGKTNGVNGDASAQARM